MSRLPAYIDIDDDVDEYEFDHDQYTVSENHRRVFVPSYPKCADCDEEGNVIAGVGIRFVERFGKLVTEKVRQHKDCESCGGIGYHGGPTSAAAAEDARHRNHADLVLIRKARYMANLPIFGAY